MLVDTETEVTSLREVPLLQLVFLDLQCSLQNFLGLGASDGDVTSNLFVTPDGEGSDGVSGLGGDGGLTGQLFQDLGSSGEPVTGFTNGDVDDELLDSELLHGVNGGGLVGLRGRRVSRCPQGVICMIGGASRYDGCV